MTDAAAPMSDAETVDALRRVKAVEAEWEARLRAAREEAEQAVRRARDEAEATLKAVAAEAGTERARRLDEGRAASERDAEAIRRDGATAADAQRAEQGKRPADRSKQIVATVLDPYSRD